MPKLLPPGMLSRLNGGINRFEAQASPDQVVDGQNVLEDDGDCRRRDAFRSIYTGPPFILPAGNSYVMHEVISPQSFTSYPNRTFTIAAANLGGNTHHLYVGCDVQFDGIDWKNITATLTSVTAHRHLSPRYYNGSSFVAMPFVLDTTIKRYVNGSNYWYQSLCQDGRISWHKSQFTTWTAHAINSITKYWIRLDLANAAGTLQALSGTGNLVTSGHGPLAFLLEPVNTIMPARFRGISAILCSADRQVPRGMELGAQLGVIKESTKSTRILHVIKDEGSGVYGQYTWSGYKRALASGNSFGWPDGSSWNAYVTGSAYTYGASGSITKTNLTVSWLNDTSTLQRNDQWRGGVVYDNVAPTGSITNNSTEKRGGFACSITNLKTNQLEGCRLLCVLNPSSGTPVGEEREIYANTTTGLSFHDHFSVTPNTDNRFDIVRPHARAYCNQSTRFQGFEITANTASAVTISANGTRPYLPDIDITNPSWVHWEFGREFQWSVPKGPFWTHCFDIITKKVLLTNGQSGLLEWDGLSVRASVALSDVNSARLQSWIGALPESTREALTARTISGSSVRSVPPKGQFVADYRGRIVVVDGTFVRWSAPAPDNDIWPYLYETQIRDSENQAATGCTTLNDSFVVWTPTAIHASGPADDDGMLSFQPLAQGIGFISHRGVCKIALGGSSFLIGPSADGVYVFNGSEPEPVLDDWRRLVDGGVNIRRLNKAVAAVSKHRNEYYLAVPSASSKVNDIILVFNYVTKKWWLYTSPWTGISSMATDYDRHGIERVLFGTEDGHIATLVKAETDDGSTITGYAKTPLVKPGGSQTFDAVAVMVEAQETGSSNTLTVKSFLNRNGYATQTAAHSFDAGVTLWNGSVNWNAATAKWGGKPLITKRVPVSAGSRAESYQLEIRGTTQWVYRSGELLFNLKGQSSKG